MTTRSKTGSSSNKPKNEKEEGHEKSAPSDSSSLKKGIAFKVGEIITLPSPLCLRNSSRFESEKQSLFYTFTMDKLFHTVYDLLPSVEDKTIDLGLLDDANKIYLYGSIGIGKSFHLFPLYHRLKQERKDLRVLYIQNCKRALKDFKMPSLLLQDVFSGGTAKDQAILDEIKKYSPFSSSIAEIDETFLLIHKTFGKKFVIIMDQVNPLFSPNSEKYSVEKIDLMIDLFGFKDFVTCLISSSANIESPARLEYYVNFVDFPISVELDKDDVEKYFQFYYQNDFELDEESLKTLEFHTGNIPLKIATFINLLKQNDSFSKASEVFAEKEKESLLKGFSKHFDKIIPEALHYFYEVML